MGKKKQLKDYSNLKIQEELLDGKMYKVEVDINGLELAVRAGFNGSFQYIDGSSVSRRDAHNALAFKSNGYDLWNLRVNNDTNYFNSFVKDLEDTGYLKRIKELKI
jgi:hypothetical protein